MAVTVTVVVLLLAIMAEVASNTIIFRGIVIFFIFGLLGTVLGSFLEIFLMPTVSANESKKLENELELKDDDIREKLGDLLEEDDGPNRKDKSSGVPTDETESEHQSDTSVDSVNSAAAL